MAVEPEFQVNISPWKDIDDPAGCLRYRLDIWWGVGQFRDFGTDHHWHAAAVVYSRNKDECLHSSSRPVSTGSHKTGNMLTRALSSPKPRVT